MVAPVTVAGILAAVLAAALAFGVARMAPTAPLARPLVVFLSLSALVQAITAASAELPQEGWALLLTPATFLAAALLMASYLRLLRVLDTPWAHWLARPGRWRTVAALLLVPPVGFSVLLAVHLARGQSPATFWSGTPAPVLILAFLANAILVAVFALTTAISAWRRAPVGSAKRARARAFGVAFVAFDAGILLSLIPGRVAEVMRPEIAERVDNAALIFLPVGSIVFVALLTYGILRTQLFDIDARSRLIASRGTIGALFVAVYVVASQAFAALLTPTLGFVMGLLVTAALVLSIVPLQRSAERFFGAVPARAEDVEDRVGLYLAAAEEFALEADPRSEERLAALATRLGLSERERAIIQHVRATQGRRPAWARSFAPGTRVRERYVIQRKLGEGSQGEVFLARDETLQRDVVIKRLASQGSAKLAEARALARVHHPAVATIFEVLVEGDDVLLIMEYVHGGSLAERLTRGPLDAAEFRTLVGDLFSGLSAIHEAGLVHRDVKPSNILRTKDGRAKLVDFGIASLAGAEETRVDPLAGSARYMSPEQARGQRVTAQSDQYSAALVLFEAWTGQAYLERLPEDDAQVVQERALAPHPRTTGDPALDAWFDRALARSPAERYASAKDAQLALDAVLATRGVRSAR